MAFIPEISWTTLEHHHNHEKTDDWYWMLGIIVLAIAILFIYFGDYLFSVLILLGGFTMLLYTQKEHKEITVTLGNKGIFIDELFFPYKNLKSFWVDDEIDGEPDQLILRTTSALAPYTIIPLAEDLDADFVTEYLLQYVDEEELHEPLAHRFMEFLGF